MNYKNSAKKIYKEALDMVVSKSLIKDKIKLKDSTIFFENEKFDLKTFKNRYIFGSGKASLKIAKILENLLSRYIDGGLIVSNFYEEGLKKIDLFMSDHPIPSQKSIDAAVLMEEKLKNLKEDDFFIYILSGGTSSLVEKPVKPITLDDLQKCSKLLIESGASIEEVNTVRKHLSLIKGGRLGKNIRAKGVVLVVSDVLGDDLGSIGSAPLYKDSSTFKDAYGILKDYGIYEKLPKSVISIIEKGAKGEIAESPKEENKNLKHIVPVNNKTFLLLAEKRAKEFGFYTHVEKEQFDGEAKDLAKRLIQKTKKISLEKKPVCVIFGGESTVTVEGKGKGGRNQEMALAALKEIRDDKNIVFLSASSDGVDGNSDAAGAVVGRDTFLKAQKEKLDIDEYLKNNDSNSFFQKTGDLIVTGPSGTNVIDMVMIFIV